MYYYINIRRTVVETINLKMIEINNIRHGEREVTLIKFYHLANFKQLNRHQIMPNLHSRCIDHSQIVYYMLIGMEAGKLA
jgi:hypothetical protein